MYSLIHFMLGSIIRIKISHGVLYCVSLVLLWTAVACFSTFAIFNHLRTERWTVGVSCKASLAISQAGVTEHVAIEVIFMKGLALTNTLLKVAGVGSHTATVMFSDASANFRINAAKRAASTFFPFAFSAVSQTFFMEKFARRTRQRSSGVLSFAGSSFDTLTFFVEGFAV